MEAYFLVDFGMTASAGDGFAIPSQIIMSDIKYHPLDKIPTTILYGKDGKVIKIGDPYVGRGQMAHEFKSRFPKRNLDPEMLSTRVEKLISDYIHDFCDKLLQQFLQEEGISTEELHAQWYLTTPGCWNDGDRRDFQLLAQKVLVNLLPGSKVHADFTESKASCEFLVDYLQVDALSWVITCDIGGATIDAALCVTKEEGRNIVPQTFPTRLASTTESGCRGVSKIDEGFQKLLKLFISVMGIENQAATEDVKRLRYSDEWRRFRHAFQGESDFVITMENSLGNSEDKKCDGFSLEGRTITIQRSKIETIFDKFLESLYSDLDILIDQIADRTPMHKKPHLIALCGGGGAMAYVLKQLKSRFSDIPIKAPLSPEESCHATIRGHRIYRLRQVLQNYLGEIHLGVTRPSSAKESRKIEWRENPTQVTVFDFTSSPRDIQVHYFIVHMKEEQFRSEQLSVNKLTKDGGSGNKALVWKLEVHLAKHLMRKQEYSVEIECTGRGRGSFSFKAYGTKSPEKALNLVSTAYFFAN